MILFILLWYTLVKVIMMDEILRPDEHISPTVSKRKKWRGEQGRTPYDGLRPWSAITHGAGVALGILGTALLLVRAAAVGGALRVTVFAIYCASMIALYLASTLYHCLRTSAAGRMNLRRIDHASIYLLIAGSYTPICLLSLKGALGWGLFGIIWTLAAAGIVLSVAWIMAPRWLTAGIYLSMGWLAVFAVYPLSQVLSARGMALLLLGGILYTIGGVLYGLKWPGRNNPRFGCHEIFHLFILAGSIAHYLLMYQIVVYA